MAGRLPAHGVTIQENLCHRSALSQPRGDQRAPTDHHPPNGTDICLRYRLVRNVPRWRFVIRPAELLATAIWPTPYFDCSGVLSSSEPIPPEKGTSRVAG